MSTFNPRPKEGPKPKKTGNPLKRTAIKHNHKPTGEKELFQALTLNLPDSETRCFVCNLRIPVLTHNNFAHVLAKGQYPKFKLNPDNIRILCHNYQGTGCHYKWDFLPKSNLAKDPNFDKMFELATELKKEYNSITNL